MPSDNIINFPPARMQGTHHVITQWDISEVLDDLFNTMEDVEKVVFFNTAKKDLIRFHHGFGTHIRNTYGLWSSHPELLASMCLPLDTHPGDVSMCIMEALWASVRGEG